MTSTDRTDVPTTWNADADLVTETAGMFSGYEVRPGFATLPNGTRHPSLRFVYSYIDAATGEERSIPPVTLVLDETGMRAIGRVLHEQANHAIRAARRGFLPQVAP